MICFAAIKPIQPICRFCPHSGQQDHACIPHGQHDLADMCAMGLSDPGQLIGRVNLCQAAARRHARALSYFNLMPAANWSSTSAVGRNRYGMLLRRTLDPPVPRGRKSRLALGMRESQYAHLTMKPELGTAALLDRSGKRVAQRDLARVRHADILSNSFLLLKDVV
jgi:hypothetical protein